MKKIIIVLFILSCLYISMSENGEEVIIPNEQIRFRIIANSNSFSDQSTKTKIKNDLVNNILPSILNSKDINQSKEKIESSLPLIENILKNYNIPYRISFGNNYFPTKNYKGVTYKSGKYESLVISLGEGMGDNWWCVLYPPLCLIEDDDSLDETIYKSYIKDVLLKKV